MYPENQLEVIKKGPVVQSCKATEEQPKNVNLKERQYVILMQESWPFLSLRHLDINEKM